MRLHGIRSLTIGLALACAASAPAQNLDLGWNTIDGGGATLSTGGQFELGGTIGQHDAGSAMTGGGFELTGGFWPGVLRGGCPGDVNGDGRVDQQDLGILLANWLQNVPPNTMGDLNGDGRVDQADLGILLANWQRACP